MAQIKIELHKGQYLNDVEPFKSHGIPTNSVVHKVIPGCGATTLEIKYTNRNSIIIVPNVPVIEDKVKEHNKLHNKEQHILGVHKGIDVGHIEDYLNSEATYKKILTTPEGFISKVLLAFDNDFERMTSDYFLLFDECERIVTDVSYRGKIAAPIDWFFKFSNKAMVSATTLPFTHQGFASFNHYVVEPKYDYSKAINVINTNNVIESLEKYINEKTTGPLFVFLNSTDAIYEVANTLDIKSQSHAYCADKSVAKLVSKKYRTGYSTLDLKEVAQYNFLTSRYFSALDIRLDYKPDVVLITDVHTAPHSILDPHTEIIQIAGRFRNGINSLTHITNFNQSMESKSKDEALHYLQGCFDTYESVVKLFANAKDTGSKETLKFFVDNSPIADFYTNDKLNQFMVDNFIYEERVKGYYQTFENLKSAYLDLSNHFKPKFVNVEYLLSDEDRINRNRKTTVKAQQWETLKQIDRLSHKPGKFNIMLPNSITLLNNLRSLYPWLTEAYDLLGYAGLEKTGLTAAKVNPAKAKANEIKALKKLAPHVYADFEENSEWYDTKIKTLMEDKCKLAGVNLKPSISLITKFFKTARSTRKGEHLYILKSKIDLASLSPFD